MLVRAFTKVNRQGNITSSAINVPSSITGVIAIKADISTSAPNDLHDSTKTISFAIEVQNGIVWNFFAGFTWRGGIYVNGETGSTVDQPGLFINIEELAGRTIRIKLNIPVTMNIGATVEWQ